jgi:hypothetical protein
MGMRTTKLHDRSARQHTDVWGDRPVHYLFFLKLQELNVYAVALLLLLLLMSSAAALIASARVICPTCTTVCPSNVGIATSEL